MPPAPAPLEFEVAPYRLSGVVYGTLLNHKPALEALGDAVHAAPYKAPPNAPVLYLKPRNTLSTHGATVGVPADAPELEVGAALGIVIGQTACRLRPEQALQCVAGYTIVNDVCVPHDVFYRPSLRFRVRDGFCPIGPVVVPRSAIANPDDLRVQIFVDGELKQTTSTGHRFRNVAQLLADVTEFMTLLPGDVLMLGASAAAPRVRAGQQSRISIEGIGELVNHYVPEGQTP
jgi:5-oxopent-3-ene-1,2,5-tricarboxylate decarboxylase/2-hydroxyhepta-2,4-diene-1,7-dioate isomerase